MKISIPDGIMANMDMSAMKTARDVNLYVYVLSRLIDGQGQDIEISMQDIRHHAYKRSHKTCAEIVEDLGRFSGVLVTINYYRVDRDKNGEALSTTRRVIFLKADIDREVVQIGINPEYRDAFVQELQDNRYTTIDYDVIQHLQGKYAKLLYMRLRQYRQGGFYSRYINDIKRDLGFDFDDPGKKVMKEITRALDTIENYNKRGVNGIIEEYTLELKKERDGKTIKTIKISYTMKNSPADMIRRHTWATLAKEGAKEAYCEKTGKKPGKAKTYWLTHDPEDPAEIARAKKFATEVSNFIEEYRRGLI